ncbi:MAG: AAA family ATPase, partial [Chloroflexi bacterium]|nr:AAA family ATPase [Chloroflexota bacterium]
DWVRLGSGLNGDLVLALAIDPGAPQILYTSVEGALFQSTDRGDRWQPLATSLPHAGVWCLAIDPQHTTHILAGTDLGVLASEDGGRHWALSSTGLPNRERIEDLVWDTRDPARVYAATRAGLYHSDDGGRSWAPMSALGGEPVSTVYVLAADPRIILTNPGLANVWRSMDGGHTWAPLAPLGDGSLVLALATHPYNPQWIYVGTEDGFYLSLDGGKTWTLSNQGLLGRDVRALVDVPGTRDELYAATRRGVYHTSDGGKNWEERSAGLEERDILLLALDRSAPSRLYAATWGGRLYATEDGGQHWAPRPTPPLRGAQMTVLLVAARPGRREASTLWLGSEGQGVWRSIDGGRIWASASQGLADLRVGAMAEASEALFLGAGQDVYRWSESANLWERVTLQPLAGRVSALLVDSRRPGYLYAATSGGGIYRRRLDGGAWEDVAQGALPANLRVDGLEMLAARGGQHLLCALTNGGVFCSPDRGLSWLLSSSGCLYGTNIRCLEADAETRGALYLGTARNGIYRGNDLARPISARAVALYFLGGTLVVAVLLVARALRGRQTIPALIAEKGQLDQRWDEWSQVIEQTLLLHHRVTAGLIGTRIPDAMLPLALRRYVDARRAQDLIFIQEPPRIEPRRFAELERLASNWRSLLERLDHIASATPIAARLTEQLCQLLGFSALSNRTYHALFGYMVRASTLRLSVPASFPIVFVLKQDLVEQDVRDIQDLMRVLNATSFFALLVVVNEDPVDRSQKETLKRLMQGSADDFIVLDYQDLCQLYLATDAERQLVQIILQQVDLSVVSPYVISGPVSGNMFFGRDYELKAITRTVRDRSFAIVGGRKIGKTSVLTKVHQLLEHTGGISAFYLDCQHVIAYREFFDALAIKCQIDVGNNPVPDMLRRVAVHLRRRQGGDTLVMLLDEVDHLLAYDLEQHMKLFRVMRALSQEGLCRFVFCGEKKLNRALHDPRSPLFNFCNILRLSYLLPRDARRIIVEPITEMGISFEQPDLLPEAIIELSSCHPNLVQAVCRSLIAKVNERGDRIVHMEDLEAVRDSDEFREFFLEVTWGNADALERLITLLMVDSGARTAEEIREALAAQGLAVSTLALEEALEGLWLFSILAREGNRYTFAARAFPDIVREAGLLEGLRDGLVEQLRAQGA